MPIVKGKQPIREGVIKDGPPGKKYYYVWGDNTKYFYLKGNEQSKKQAFNKALHQERAIFMHPSNGFQGKRYKH
jgi:hypothetical protein